MLTHESVVYEVEETCREQGGLGPSELDARGELRLDPAHDRLGGREREQGRRVSTHGCIMDSRVK